MVISEYKVNKKGNCQKIIYRYNERNKVKFLNKIKEKIGFREKFTPRAAQKKSPAP